MKEMMTPMQVLTLLITIGLGVMMKESLGNSNLALSEISKLRIHVAESYINKQDAEKNLQHINHRLDQIWEHMQRANEVK